MAVYLARFGALGPVKIGYTSDIGRRLGELSTRLWDDIHLIRLLEGTEKDERLLHRRFAAQHIRYEWFHYHPAMMGDLGLPEIELASDAAIASIGLDATEEARHARSGSLRAWMISEGLDEHRLARLMDCSTNTVSEWLRFGNLPSKAARAKLVELSGGKLAHSFGVASLAVAA